MMGLPVATRLVVQALREEATYLSDDPRLIEQRIECTLRRVADRLEEAGSSVHPRAATPGADGVTVSSDACEPGSGNKSHPGPEVVVTHPGAVHAVLVELKREIEPYGPTPRIRQLLDDAIKLSS